MTDAESIICKMLLIRRFEEEIIARYPKQLIRCPVHLSISQEAIAVGVCHRLRKEDAVFSTHRNHAHYIAKGGDIEKFALELHGKVGGCNDGRGGSMHAIDTSVNFMSGPIVASAIPLAVGAALANKMDGNDNIVVCFFGDAAVEEGVFHESMNFASLMQLPIIFVCENNRYSVDTPIEKRQANRELWKLGEAHGVTAYRIYDNNALSLARKFEKIIDDTRKKSSPNFVAINTQRSHVHCGVSEEFDIDKDPVDACKDYDDTEIKALISKAFDAAEAAPLPTPDMASKYVYA